MRCCPFLLVVLLSVMTVPAVGQTETTPSPEPEIRPPVVEVIDDSVQTQIIIRQNDEGDIVEEHRVNGKLYQITVTPEHGASYTLVDHSGEGAFVPLEMQGMPRLSVPMWVIGTF
jgi:hypothetical protein